MPLPSIFGDKAHDWIVLTAEQLIVKALGTIFSHLPKPDLWSVSKHNSKLLVTWRDEFLENESCPTRKKAIEGIWNYIIFKYESSTFYSQRIDWIMEKVRGSDWTIIKGSQPIHWWKIKETEEVKRARKLALLEAIKNKEYSRTLDLID